MMKHLLKLMSPMTCDLATHLTGRHIPISVFPFSYAEYSRWIGHDTEEDWKKYFFDGGLPETFQLPDKKGYVSALYNSIVSKDILGRRKVRNAQRFVNAAYVLMQQFAREVMKNSDGDLRILFILSS